MARLKELEAERPRTEGDVRRRADQGRDSPGGDRGKALRPSRRREMAKEAIERQDVSTKATRKKWELGQWRFQ